ncbi:hypothetical protein [Nocardia abscessus]|uniref:hypothetical protein n=1 Tax=Nocardia abscessus TaxID=120957 RepID=UPI0024557129|nr:hypothetical protein [Nocardia abscessus]
MDGQQQVCLFKGGAARGLSGAILTSGKATTDTARPWRLVAQNSATVPAAR